MLWWLGQGVVLKLPWGLGVRYTSQPFLHNWHTPQRKLAPRFAGINPAKVVPTVDSPPLWQKSLDHKAPCFDSFFFDERV